MTKRTFDGVVFTRPEAFQHLVSAVQKSASLVTVERDFLLFAVGKLDGDPEQALPEPASPEPVAPASPEAAPPPRRKKSE